MKNEDIIKGMKVVPFQKSIFKGLGSCYIWNEAKNSYSPYLIVDSWNKKQNCWVLTNVCERQGESFNSCDFELYVE